jgi:hypothetical protein
MKKLITILQASAGNFPAFPWEGKGGETWYLVQPRGCTNYQVNFLQKETISSWRILKKIYTCFLLPARNHSWNGQVLRALLLNILFSSFHGLYAMVVWHRHRTLARKNFGNIVTSPLAQLRIARLVVAITILCHSESVKGGCVCPVQSLKIN